MKVKYLLLSLMGAMALSASAQTTAPEDQNQLPARKTAFDRSAGHWFITLQGGVSAQFLEGNQAQDFVKRLHVMPTLSIGKWHNPYFATRLQLMAG
ncbi:MAG: OmpA family protein, partial [Porphyromonas sp.]|nr:OmpA family protein [Porphyromonas sp.]